MALEEDDDEFFVAQIDHQELRKAIDLLRIWEEKFRVRGWEKELRSKVKNHA